MLRRRSLRALAPLAAALAFSLAPPAAGVHLFPLAEGDPGGSCGTGLAPAPDNSAGQVRVDLLFFEDHESMSSTTEINAGESVTWTWGDLNPYCHSVTGGSFTTFGGDPAGFNGMEPELIRPVGQDNSYTVSFDQPGTFAYSCVHHASVGMVGEVIVK